MVNKILACVRCVWRKACNLLLETHGTHPFVQELASDRNRLTFTSDDLDLIFTNTTLGQELHLFLCEFITIGRLILFESIY